MPSQSETPRRPSQTEGALRLTPAERMARFAELQRQAFRLLEASPEGLRHFRQRNLRQRRIHAITRTTPRRAGPRWNLRVSPPKTRIVETMR